MFAPTQPLVPFAPADAWQPWRPDAKNPWNLKWAAHLFRRAAFGAPAYDGQLGTWEGLQRAVKEGPEATITRLLDGGPGLKDFDVMLDDLGPRLGKRRPFEFPPDGRDFEIRAWWLYRMIFTPHPLQERMTLFWHNHFATSIAKVRRAELMVRQNQTIRAHALGKFRPFLEAISRDPATLIWLDSNSNVKSHPNENYARELLELFSLGVGNYTETDVREAARAFTGWHTDGQAFAFNPAQHDDGVKTVLDRTGRWNGDDIIRIALEQPAAGRFLARKLFKQFISEADDPPVELLEPLAEQLRRTDYDIGAAVKTILRSRIFFSEYAYRRRVKSPVDFIVGLVRTLDGKPSAESLALALDGMGQTLFAPPNVKGWDGGKAWLNTATLLARHNLAWAVVGGGPVSNPAAERFGRQVAPGSLLVDVAPIVQKHAGQDAGRQVDFLLRLFLQGDVNPAARPKLVAFLTKGEPKDDNWVLRIREVAHTILLMPEYQLA
jgi:hypothetical protein